MNHDNKVESVDVELLAECGKIAHRLRRFEHEKWSIELKDLQKRSLKSFGQLPLSSSQSVAQRLNEFFDGNGKPVDNADPELVNRIQYLEDLVIKIHCQQEFMKQQKLATNSNKKVHIKSNMNYSAPKNNNNDLTTSPPGIHELLNDDNTHSCTQSSGGENNNKTNDDEDDMDENNPPQTTVSNKKNVHQHHHHHHHQHQQLENTKIASDDLELLLCELKRKIDFTEKMNWLCLSNRPSLPPHRKSSLPKHSNVKAKFLEMCHTTLSDDVKAALRLPSFDSYDWEDYEILHLMEMMFVELNFIEKFHISSTRLREWLYEVYKHYNDVPFHNFRHCFCVSQMMYAITWQANLTSCLGDMDAFILLVSCICHDLDHPGYNNIYQINAKTELALRYNDISPLENHHCSIAFRLLENPDCNVLENITKDMYKEIREGIIRCILATDMARHNEILTQFREIIPIFDFHNNSHKNLLCMVLIKVADISNEARPMDVAEPWLDRLLQEFFAQSAAEKMEGLPVTPFMDPEKVSKPGSQVRFIGLVLLPLFEALGELLPELVDFIVIPVRVALDFYKRLNDASQKNRKSLTEGSSDGDEIIPRSQSGISVRSRRSIPSLKSASRNSVDEEPMLIAAELHDLPEGSESGDSETATEVDVAEKTSKFKVDTESRNKLNSQMGLHRKSNHRDKRPSMVSEMGGRMRGSYGNLQNNYNSRTTTFGSNRAISLDHYNNHRRMSDGIQSMTVNSDSSVYYNQRMHDHDVSMRAVPSSATPILTSPLDIKVQVIEDSLKVQTQSTHADVAVDNCESHRVQSNNTSSIASSKSHKTKLSSSVNCSSSPKSIITRLRQLTGRLTFSFDKDSRRMSAGNQTVNKPATTENMAPKNNNIMQNVCCKSAMESRAMRSADAAAAARNRASSLDVPTLSCNNACASSNEGSRKSLTSTKYDDDSNSNTDNSNFPAKKESGSEVDVPDI